VTHHAAQVAARLAAANPLLSNRADKTCADTSPDLAFFSNHRRTRSSFENRECACKLSGVIGAE